jgi:hypothetical protein
MPALLDYTDTHPADVRAQWVHLKHLGHGGQGDMSKVQEITSGKQFPRNAIRFTSWDDPIRDDEEKERRESLIRDEVAIMQKLPACSCGYMKPRETTAIPARAPADQ